MSQKNKIYLLFAFLGLFAVSFFLGQCSTKKERSQGVANLAASRDSIKTYSIKIDGLRNSIFEKNAIILSQEDAIKAGLIREDVLKKLHIRDMITNTDLSGIIKHQDSLLSLPPQTVFITINDTSGVKHDYVRIPFKLLDVKNKYLILLAGMDKTRTAYYSLRVPFAGKIFIGYTGEGFLHLKQVPKGMFMTENPHIIMNTMDVIIIQDSKKWYEKWWIHALGGAAVDEGLRRLFKK